MAKVKRRGIFLFKVLPWTISAAHREIKCMDLRRVENLTGAHCKLVLFAVKLIKFKCIIVTVEFERPVDRSITGLHGDGSGGALRFELATSKIIATAHFSRTTITRCFDSIRRGKCGNLPEIRYMSSTQANTRENGGKNKFSLELDRQILKLRLFTLNTTISYQV